MRDYVSLLLRVDWRRLVSVAGFLLAVACLVFLGYFLYRERDVLAMLLFTADPRQVVAIVAWYLVDLMIYVAGWASIMARLGERVSLVTHIRIFCQANAAKRLPGTVWYIGGRATLYSRVGIPARVVVAASAIEGVLIWLSGLTLSIPFLMVILPNHRWGWFGVGSLLLVIILNPWVLRRLLNWATQGSGSPPVPAVRAYRWLALYGAGWAIGGGLVFAILAMFQAASTADLPAVIGSWIVAGTASMLTFFLPSGFGVTEVTLTVLLSRVTPTGVAALTAISARVITTLLDVVFGGLAYLFGMAVNRR